jgi:hypothetical protein
MKKHEQTGHEAFCLTNAAYFTAVRGFGAKRTRTECESIERAREVAAGYGDGRTMIYAITAEGRSAHIENA